MREESAILRHVADAAAQGDRVEPQRVGTLDGDGAAVDVGEPIERAQEGRLA